jgi:flagellar biosynthesis chaperone FliJ
LSKKKEAFLVKKENKNLAQQLKEALQARENLTQQLEEARLGGTSSLQKGESSSQ